jgi:hypothetical protein
MQPDNRTILDASAWILLAKGLVLVPVAIYLLVRARRAGAAAPSMGVVTCAGGVVALTLAGLAVRMRRRLG